MPRPCSACHQRSIDGLASIYWAWYPQRDVRVAYVSKLCIDCTTTHVVPLAATTPLDRAESGSDNCALCGIGTADDPNYLYATVYAPHQNQADLEALLCGPCMATMAGFCRENGRSLPDRGSVTDNHSRADARWSLLAG